MMACGKKDTCFFKCLDQELSCISICCLPAISAGGVPTRAINGPAIVLQSCGCRLLGQARMSQVGEESQWTYCANSLLGNLSLDLILELINYYG